MDCARNIITAAFPAGKTETTTAPLWQWDYGQALCITGIDLPAAFEVHFSTNRTGGVSTVAVGADGQVTIPNDLLTIGKNLNAWIYLSDAQGEGETEYAITIPVKARPMPETYDAEVSGEFDDVVRQVSEYAQTAQTAADNAGASASAAAASASEAAASASAAETAKNAAETAQGKAEDAQAAAETAAQTATEKTQQTAQDAAQAAQSKADAESAAGRAEAAQTGAESAKTDAETAAQGAAASASAASASASSAGQAAISAGQSATAAAGSATTAQGAAQTATTKAGEASASATAANTAKTAAQTAQTGAETAETNAGQSASTASTKAAEAAQSATDAAASKTAAEAAATRAEQAAATLTVDSALSDTSTNPVQNKVITGEVTQVKSTLKQVTGGGEIKPTREGAYINTSGTTADIAAFVTDATFNVFVVPCISGDKFTVDATGGNAPRAFAFLTSDGTILQKAGAGYHTNNVLTAPDNSAYLVINDRTAHTQYYGVMLPGEIDDINADLFNYTGNSEILFSEPSSGEYIVTNAATVDWTTPSVSVSTYIKWAVIDCEEGDTFTVNGKGGYSDRLWAFADAQKNIVRVSEPQATAENLVLTAQAGEVYLILNDETNKRSYYGEFIKVRVDALEDTVSELDTTVSTVKSAFPFIGTAQLQYTKIQASVLGTVNQSYINFLAYPNSKSFVCKVLPNAKYYVVNPGGDRFRIVTTSFNPLDYVGGNQQAVDGNYFYGDESTDLVVTTKSTDGYMTVCFTTSNQDISAMTAIYGNKENADKLLLHNLIVHDNKIGYSVDDTGAYYSSNTDYMGGYISTTTDISLLYAIYDALVAAYPAQVTKETFCTDTADNVTYMYKFVPPNIYNRSHERKTVFIICGTHGFETPQMFHCANMFKEMLENWKTEPAFEALIMNYDFAVIPCLNVYGFTHDTRKNERGVDLNRNYETGWSEATGTEYTDPSSQYYKGTAPFSEVQTQAVRNYILTNAYKIAFCMDFHFAGSQTYINSTMDYIRAFYGWESHMNGWLMKHPDFALMDTSTNKTYLMYNMHLGSAALWLNTVRPSILLETTGTVGIVGDSNAKTTQNYSETAFINALLFGLRWLRN